MRLEARLGVRGEEGSEKVSSSESRLVARLVCCVVKPLADESRTSTSLEVFSLPISRHSVASKSERRVCRIASPRTSLLTSDHSSPALPARDMSPHTTADGGPAGYPNRLDT